MTVGYAFRTMVEDDAQAAGRLLRHSFESRIRPYLPYCSPDLANYLSVIVRSPLAYPDRQLYVAEREDGEVCGFAEFRSHDSGDDLFAYMCVSESDRGSGIATRFVQHHIATRSSTGSILLDVFEHNQGARRLFDRLGFGPTDLRTTWWTRAIPEVSASDPGRLQVHDWHVASASLATFGFCVMDVTWAGAPLRLALPSASAIRAPNQAAYHDPVLMGTLKQLVPSLSHVLWAGPDDLEMTAGSEQLLTSLRVRAPVPFSAAISA